MNRKAFKTCAGLLASALGTLLGVAGAGAQTPPNPGGGAAIPRYLPGDWPNLGAYNNRQGRNGDPLTYNSGQTNLRWLAPSLPEQRNPLTLDDTDLEADFFSNSTVANRAASIDDPLYDGGRVEYSATGWFAPGTPAREASDAYVPLQRNRIPGPLTPPGYALRQRPRTPAYHFAFCVPSLKNSSDPTQAVDNANRRFVDYVFTPPVGLDRNYQLQIHLPVGPTVTGTNTRTFPQRFYVARVYFGPDGADADRLGDEYYTEVFDTARSGSGWVTLGGGGFATNRVFPYSNASDDRYPVTVRVFNTVPRYDDGALALPDATAFYTDQKEKDEAARRVVYADGARAIPRIGTIEASPTTQTFTAGTTPDGTHDGRVTIARNDFVTQFVASDPQNLGLGGYLDQSNQGTIVSYFSNPSQWNQPTVPREAWRYSLVEESGLVTAVDNRSGAANVPPDWTQGDTTNDRHVGADYASNAVVSEEPPLNPADTPAGPPAGVSLVNYTPDLLDGDYAIYAYIGSRGTNSHGQIYGRNIQVRIFEGGTRTDAYVNQDAPRADTATNGGWVRIGTRRFRNVRNNQDATYSAPLRVEVTNYSRYIPGATVAQAVSDYGTTRVAYADAIRFVGAQDRTVNSTPVHANVKIQNSPAAKRDVDGNTKVVIAADETGRIHCLDATGNGDGTTTEYWSYPSTPDPTVVPANSWKDPNIWNAVSGTSGIDGTPNPTNTQAPFDNTPQATMPSSFDLSTAAVAHVQTGIDSNGDPVYTDYLYIGATNGRVYCIDMAGRGDFSAANRKIGTTTRVWTYPDDYDPTKPKDPIGSSTLGAFRGSVVFGNAENGAGGVQTVYAAARNGRIFAINAVGNGASRTTGQRWQYPADTLGNLPEIQMTPTLFQPRNAATNAIEGNGRLMFGTMLDDATDGLGRLYALDAKTGKIVWRYNGGILKNPDDDQDLAAGDADVPAGSRRLSSTAVFSQANGYPANTTAVESFGSFVAGMVAVPASQLDGNKSDANAVAPAHVDTLYAFNNNGFLYAFNARTGDPITYTRGATTYRYASNDTLVTCDSNLAFTFTKVFNRNQATYDLTDLETLPIIVVPGADGRMREVFARAEDYNAFEGYVADGKTVSTPLSGVAASNSALYMTENGGTLTAFDEKGALAGNLNPSPYYYTGVTDVVPPNDPRGNAYRKLKVRLLSRKGYLAYREVNNAGTSDASYLQAINQADFQDPKVTAGTSVGNPVAFEWGETAYVMVYGFPYSTTADDGNGNQIPVPPPQITLTLQSESGRTVRQVQVDARQFPINAAGDPPNVDGSTDRANGYAVVPFVFQNSGANSLPPGGGRISASITSGAVAGGTAEILQDTRPGNPSNPGSTIRFLMANPLALRVYALPRSIDPSSRESTIGNTTTSNDSSNLVNGSPDLPGSSVIESQLLASAGWASHGASATAVFNVIDRSLMGLVQEEGLNNVRLTRTNLERQGGAAGRFRPLDTALFPGFEDAPVNRPNRSLDYPNIGREQVRAAKDPNGSAQDPIQSTVRLRQPTDLTTGKRLSELNEDELANFVTTNRRFDETPFNLTIDVPRYQPPVFLLGSQFAPVGPVDDPNNNNGNAPVFTDDATSLLRRRRDAFGNDALPQGYFGRVQVYVDSQPNNARDEGDNPEAYRAFNYTLGVTPQTSLLVGSPTVDLGPLAGGTGYAPANPFAAGAPGLGGPVGPFNPWLGDWRSVYQPIVVRNDGNVNLIDLRVPKATNETGAASGNLPLALTSTDNDPLAWMSATLRDGSGALQPGDLWSNIDTTFAARNRFNTNRNYVILPKPRVVDRGPSELVANPYPRANPNLRVDAGTRQLVQYPSGVVVDGSNVPNNRIQPALESSEPKVGVSVPLGFPVGNYSSLIRVVENVDPNGTAIDDDILNYYPAAKSYEPYSDPIALSWKVRETRLTNRSTPRTAWMIDDASAFANLLNGYAPNAGDPPVAGARRRSYRNAAPSAMRNADGSLTVAFESDRDAKNADLDANPGKASPDAAYASRLHFAQVANSGGVPNTGNATGNGPLYDLNGFSGGASQWFTRSAAYPAGNGAAQFGGGTIVGGTLRFGSPSYPMLGGVAAGGMRANTRPTFASVILAFVGEAQVSTNTGRLSESKVFVASGPGGVPSGAPTELKGDPLTAKGKPSVVQTGATGALVFYSETSAGQSGIALSRVAGVQSATARLSFGDGFSSVFSPSASARTFAPGTARQASVVDLSFAGKLRGRPNAEVYLGRLRSNGTAILDAAGVDVTATPNAGNPFLLMPQQANERLVSEGNGLYRARGVAWSRANVKLMQTTATDPVGVDLIASAPTVDRQSGLIAADSRLGGKVYLDPELGTVRFVGGAPGRNATLRLTYQPTFLRVTPGGTAGYSAVNGLWDERYVSETAQDNSGAYFNPYWYKADRSLVRPADGVRNDRYLFVYGRGAAGGGVTARPYMTSMRLGLRLGGRVATDANGNLASVPTVTPTDGLGALHPYQVDPANGRIYFMAEDENRTVSVSYRGVSEANNAANATDTVVAGTVSFVLERDEAPVLVDEAANDSSVMAFIDPFTQASAANSRRERPPLVWLFYTSTRAGGPDVYMQSIAPRYSPFPR